MPASFKSTDWQAVIVIAALFALLQLIDPTVFRYQQNWLESLEIWRLLSAHLVHVGWVHLLINLAGLVVLVALIQPGWSRGRWSWQIAVLAIAISIGFTVFQQDLRWYAGFSGVLFGLYLLGAFSMCRRGDRLSLVIILLISAKLVTEQMGFDQLNSSQMIGAPVIVDAHLYGSVGAIAIEVLAVTIRRLLSSDAVHEENA